MVWDLLSLSAGQAQKERTAKRKNRRLHKVEEFHIRFLVFDSRRIVGHTSDLYFICVIFYD